MDATISDTSTDQHGYSDTSMCIADDKWMTKVAGFKTELVYYIKTNSEGIQRRRKGLSRGTKMTPQGGCYVLTAN